MSETIGRELKRGTLELVLLKLLSEREMYGYQLNAALSERGGEQFSIKEGTLYPVLYRLEDAGFIEARWEMQERGNPRKYYRLTDAGQQHLRLLLHEWRTFVAVLDHLLGA